MIEEFLTMFFAMFLAVVLGIVGGLGIYNIYLETSVETAQTERDLLLASQGQTEQAGITGM